jgi:ABC-2 type transport system permease protein
VETLRAEGQKQVAGQSRFIVCDLSQPADQPEPCKLSGTNVSSDIAALANQRRTAGTSNVTLVIPDHFGADLSAGTNVTVSVDVRGGPTAVQAIQQQIESVNARIGGAIIAARVVTDKAQGDAAFYDKVYTAANTVWAKDPIQITESTSTTTGKEAGTGFGQSAPGIGAMFVLMTGLILADVFIEERTQGTLQRLMVLPLHKSQVLAGKLLGQYLVALTVFAVMLIVGTVFGIRWGDPLGVIAIVLVYTFAVTALGLLLSTLVKTSGQANGLRLLAAMILSPLGGAWWPLSIVPVAMQNLGKISPIYWSQDAFSKMIFYGGHLPEIMPSIVVLLVFGLVVFALGSLRFRYE